MNYRLICLTHGDPAFLHRTIASFREMVTPTPDEAYLIIDRPGNDWAIAEYPLSPGRLPWLYTALPGVGFCEATGIAWKTAAAAPPEPRYVFWLEHDFEFNRPVDLSELACVLEHDHDIAQVALMRDAVNDAERAAGGLFELRRDEYRYPERPAAVPTRSDVAVQIFRYLEHRSYFTTNPSLMTRRFMAENPWMSYVDQCEGKFGLDLVERGYHFATWGDGDPWVRHIGERGNGHGY